MAGSTEWRTPPAFFDALYKEFTFNVDAAATGENALIGRKQHHGECHVVGRRCIFCGDLAGSRFYTRETDGTKLEHYGPGDVVWCNPPYSPGALLYRFVKVASESSRCGATWVMLLNATTTDTRWFHEFIWDREMHRPRDRVEVRFLKKRLAFHGVLNTPIPSPRYSNMIVVFRPPLETK